MPTPSGVTIYAIAPDGTKTDVTEGVQALYDGVIQSMDWGSGFLSVEDAEPIAQVADVCGFQGVEEARRYLAQRRIDTDLGARLQRGEIDAAEYARRKVEARRELERFAFEK